MATSKASKAVFDVSKPGKSAASATSKPVIITNRPIVKDPTLLPKNDEKTANPDVEEQKSGLATTSRTAKSLQPSVELKAETTKAEDTPTEQAEDSAVVDAVADQAAGKKKSSQDKADAEQAEKIQKLIEDKKYFVPISTPRARRRGVAVIIMVAALLLAIATVYLLLDAKVINSEMQLPVEFIKN